MKHANWLGRPVRAQGQGSFEAPGAGRRGERGARWPRSGPRDLALALEAVVPGSRAWCEVEPAARARALRAFAREVESALGRAPELPGFLDLEEREWRRVARLERAKIEGATRGTLPPARAGVSVVRSHWSELARGPVADLVHALGAGRGVVLLADARFPHLGDLLGEAWLRRSPVPEALAVLHGADPELVEAAADETDVDDALLVGTELELEEAAEVEGLRTREVRNGSVRVRAGEDLEARARDLARAAFGREALSGQAPGQVARLLVDEQAFSRFGTAFLAATEALAAEPSVPLVDRAAARDVRELAQLGLDEGATLIHGGEATRLAERDRVRSAPLVFTNVEPEMRVFARRAPAPLALLVRVSADPPPA